MLMLMLISCTYLSCLLEIAFWLWSSQQWELYKTRKESLAWCTCAFFVEFFGHSTSWLEKLNFIIAMKLFGGGFFFRCRKVLNMRLFPNEKNGKAWDQNVSLWIFPLCNFSKSGPLCFGKSTKDSQFPFWQIEQMEVGSVLQVMQKSYSVLLGKPFFPCNESLCLLIYSVQGFDCLSEDGISGCFGCQ